MTLKVEGTIPIDLEGTYFRNGPGLQVNMAGCNRHTFGEMTCIDASSLMMFSLSMTLISVSLTYNVTAFNLDGDGMVFSSLAIKDGKAFFRNKFVQTKGFLAEQVRQKDQSFRLAVDYAMIRWTILSCS